MEKKEAEKYPDNEAAQEYCRGKNAQIPLKYLYFKRVRFFERLNNSDYDGLCQEKTDETAAFFGVTPRQIWDARRHLSVMGLGRTVRLAKKNGFASDKRIFISYVKIRELVEAGRLDDDFLIGLAE